MQKHPQITQNRIQNALKLIEPLIHPQSLPVAVEAWTVGGEPVPYHTAVKAVYEPVSVGYKWGPAWDTTWFRVRGEVPASWKGREVVVLFNIGSAGWEGLGARGRVGRGGGGR